MSAPLYTCIDCKQPQRLSPPLSARTHEGAPMTRVTALFLFRDSKGGRCVDCYVKHQAAETAALIQRLTNA